MMKADCATTRGCRPLRDTTTAATMIELSQPRMGGAFLLTNSATFCCLWELRCRKTLPGKLCPQQLFVALASGLRAENKGRSPSVLAK